MTDFAKYDASEPVSLEDIFGDLEADGNSSLAEALDAAIKAMADSVCPPELDGYYLYKIIHNDRPYYPVEGTLKNTALGLMFADALVHEEGSQDAYVIIPDTRNAVFYWLPSGRADDQAEAEGLPQAA